jgi:hypothetical protein
MRGHFRGHLDFDLNTVVEMSYVGCYAQNMQKNATKKVQY